jgi:hypothetical protein
MKQKAKKYINSLYIDYGDLNDKAEEQIKQAFIDGMNQQLILSGVVKSLPNKYCPQCGEPIKKPHKFWCESKS